MTLVTAYQDRDTMLRPLTVAPVAARLTPVTLAPFRRSYKQPPAILCLDWKRDLRNLLRILYELLILLLCASLSNGFSHLLARSLRSRNEIGRGDYPMQDVLWVAVTIVFFALSVAYVRFCDRMK